MSHHEMSHYEQQPTPTSPHPVPFIARLIGAGIVIVTLGAAGIFGWQATYAAGLRGTHGEFTVSHCSAQTVGYRSHGKHRTREEVKCTGTYASDDGRAEDSDAYLEPDAYHSAGTKLSVTRTDSPAASASPRFSYVEANAWNTGLLSAFAFAMLIGTALGAFVFTTGCTGTRSRVSYGDAWRSTAGGAKRPVILGLAGVGALGAVVSVLLGVVL